MTLTELRELYGHNRDKRKIVLYDVRTRDGFEINDAEQFDQVIEILGEEVYILNETSNEEVVIFDFFTLDRASKPYCAVLRHPYLSNAYWKEMPDEVLGVFAAPGGIYNYLRVNYTDGMYDIIIELPPKVDKEIFAVCRQVFPTFYARNKSDHTTSIVFTNTERFRNLKDGFFLWEMDEINLEVKRKTPLQMSRALWKTLREFRIKDDEEESRPNRRIKLNL